MIKHYYNTAASNFVHSYKVLHLTVKLKNWQLHQQKKIEELYKEKNSHPHLTYIFKFKKMDRNIQLHTNAKLSD